MKIVLLVDDEELVRRATARLLKRCGFAPEGAASVDEALARLSKSPAPALIISDLQMPDRTGEELFTEVARRFPGLPFVIASGNVLPEDRVRLTALGVSAFLEKPFSEAALKDLVTRLVAA